MRATILRMLSTSALSAFSLSAATAGVTPVSQPFTINPVRGDTQTQPPIRLPAPQAAPNSSASPGIPSPSAGQAVRRGSLIDLSV